MPFLLIDKPAGLTSHDVVDYVRKVTGEKRVGHSGTLDPFATGLLIIGVGRDCTKHLGSFLGMDKSYQADIVLGATTDTLDSESPEMAVPGTEKKTAVSIQEIEKAVQQLTGKLQQIPPKHAAIKIKGKKLYELAREGKEVEAAPRDVIVHSWKPLFEARNSFPLPVTLAFEVNVSSGTYIRALARDLGTLCGTGGYVRYLRRLTIGEHTLENAIPMHDLTKENWLDVAKNDLYLLKDAQAR